MITAATVAEIAFARSVEKPRDITMADSEKLEHQCLVGVSSRTRWFLLNPTHVNNCAFYFFVKCCSFFSAKRIRVGVKRRSTLDIAPTEHHTQCKYRRWRHVFFLNTYTCVRRIVGVRSTVPVVGHRRPSQTGEIRLVNVARPIEEHRVYIWRHHTASGKSSSFVLCS